MKLVIVVPCYNEEEVLSETTSRLSAVIQRMVEEGRITEGQILYVDDGSRDKTWSLVESLSSWLIMSVISKLCGPAWNGLLCMPMLLFLLMQICRMMSKLFP